MEFRNKKVVNRLHAREVRLIVQRTGALAFIGALAMRSTSASASARSLRNAGFYSADSSGWAGGVAISCQAQNDRHMMLCMPAPLFPHMLP